MSPPLLITGTSGQLGHALARLAARQGTPHVAVSRPQFDFDRPETLEHCLAAVRPCAVVNAAAYTAVDAAETDQAAAERANAAGPARLAALCARHGIPLIHVSTDYVFDGRKRLPYIEEDPANPASVYGASKRAGEIAVLASGAAAVILRTSWLYGAYGRNFVRTMLNAALESRPLRVVDDQTGCPTAAEDLAKAILQITGQIQGGWREAYRGIFHAACAGETSWHGFARAIFAAAAPQGLAMPALTPIHTAEWPAPAPRPANSTLDCAKLAGTFGCFLPPWQQSLPEVVAELLHAEREVERLH